MLEVRTISLRYRYWALSTVLSLSMWFIFSPKYYQPLKFMSHQNDMDLWDFSRRVEIGNVKYMKAGGEVDDRGWDGWIASLTQRTWVWVGSGSWWWTGKPGMLQSLWCSIRHDWVTELNWSPIWKWLIAPKSWHNVVGPRMVFTVECHQKWGILFLGQGD